MEDKVKTFLEIDFFLFFKEAIEKALDNQRLKISQESTFYLIGVLSRELKNDPSDIQRIANEKAIGIRYHEALRIPMTRSERVSELKALGDSSLVIAGMWWPSLIRKIVSVDYYIAIGSQAYKRASEECSSAHAGTLKELSRKFCNVVNILTEATKCISLSEDNISDRDVLRMYEIYLRTHNPFFRQMLRSLNINVVPGTTTKQ